MLLTELCNSGYFNWCWNVVGLPLSIFIQRQKTGTNSAMFLKFNVTEFVTFENIWCLQSPKMFLDKWMRLHSSNYRYTIPLIIASKPHSWINWCSTSISQNLRNTKGQGGGLAWHKTICCLGVECMHFFAKFGNLVNRVYNNLHNFTTKKYTMPA